MTKVNIEPSIKAVIWDLDGTLIDSFGIFKEIAIKLAPEFSKPVPTDEEFLVNYHGSLKDSLHAVFGGDFNESVLDDLIARFLTEQEAYYESIDEHILEDAARLAHKLCLAGLSQAIVTNREHAGRGNASPRHIVEYSELGGYIDHIVCGDEVVIRKPEAAVASGLLQEWKNISPEEIVVIGDQFVDAELAVNLGSSGIIVDRTQNSGAGITSRLRPGWQSRISVVNTLADVTYF